MTDRVALITGAGSGIGLAATHRALGRDGFSLVLCGRRLEPLEEAAKEITEVPVLTKACDVGSPDQVEALFSAAMDRFGRLDVLFNNAGFGGTPAIPFEDLSFEQWSNVVAANLTGTFLCTQQAFRIMHDQDPQGGRIINNGSISAHVPRPLSAPYTATKHGITGLTRSASLDGRRYNIACGQIDVGNAGTPLTERMTRGVLQPDGTTMVEPTFDVQHVAQAVSYMASLPLDTNVQFLTVMATQMPYVGRG